MRIVHHRTETDFTIISNEIVRDTRLSYRALGVLLYLLSRPDGWHTNALQLSRERKEGRDALLTALDEIEEAGYLWRPRSQDEQGRWRTDWHVFDRPSPKPENPDSGEPDSGEPDSGSQASRTRTESKNRDQELLAPDGATDEEAEPALFPGSSLPAVSTKARRRDQLFEALMVVAGVDLADIPPSARGAYNRARADLAAVGATPEEVIRRGAIFRATWPDIRLTPTALARRWAEVGAYVPNSTAHAVRMQAEQHDLIARMRALDEREAM